MKSIGNKRKVACFVDMAKKDGLDIALDQRAEPDRGYYCSPVIIQDCPADHPCWTDEIFGPFLVVQRASGNDYMLKIANNTRFGLGAAIFSQNQSEVM